MTISLKPRLRMAPSPTGFMHLGTLRTALFAYLLAKKWEGSFILRIEDTDQKREVEGAAQNLLKVFSQFNIVFDEGPGIGGSQGPYIQSERLDIYKKYAEDLVARGEAYYCFASPEELEQLREEQAARKEAPRYDRRFRDLPLEEAKKRIANGDSFVIRHKIPLEGKIVVKDELRGEISFNAEDIDDYVLLKSDGFPTYQLASVIDDHLMSITHVTRGDEWIPSLPKNILLYKSFNWEAPKFLHFPLILNKNGGKLSKRQGDVFVEDFLNKGYLKEALLNFCVLLGWHPKNDQEIFSMDELKRVFDSNGISVSPAIFDEEKLDFYNSYYIKNLSSTDLLAHAKPFLQEHLVKTAAHKQTDEFITAVLALEQPRLKVLSELHESTAFFFEEKLEYDPALLVWKKITMHDTKQNLQILLEKLSQINEGEWTLVDLEKNIVEWLRSEHKQLGDFLWPMRVALSGKKASPGPFEIASVIGKTETLEKIKHAASKLS